MVYSIEGVVFRDKVSDDWMMEGPTGIKYNVIFGESHLMHSNLLRGRDENRRVRAVIVSPTKVDIVSII